MQLLDPDILREARHLSLTVSLAGLTLGLMLYLFGWWGHRFWIVLITTVVAGVCGLYSGSSVGAQPMVAGLLLALAAGVLALALVRVIAFGFGGFTVWVTIHTLFPSWNEWLICFLLGGLLGLVLFRFWTMVLTSFAGSLLMSYSGLCLADRLGKLDAVTVADKNGLLLNWAFGGMVVLGVALQFFLERRRARQEKKRQEEEKKPVVVQAPPPKVPWYRRAAG
jgi:MFS family permease